MKNNEQKNIVFVGTYTRNESEGIYSFSMEGNTGNLTLKKIIPGIQNPSYLTISFGGERLYTVNELNDYQGEKSGSISSFVVDKKRGDLKFLNRKATRGGAPCYISVDRQEQYIFVSNYLGGNIAVFSVGDKGQIGEMTDCKQHYGSGITKRQQSPHPHSIITDPFNNFVFVPDLSLDKIMIYDFKKGKLEKGKIDHAVTEAGAGPRHILFHPEISFVYVINELDSSITVFEYYPEQGSLQKTQKITTLPSEYDQGNICADIHIHPSGDYLYASNRGHDSIAIYEINKENGHLSLLDFQDTRGKTPRNFCIDPAGKFLLVANQDSDNIVIFKINEQGKLEFTGNKVRVPDPVCVKII